MNISILGSTGSIGTQALEVVREFDDMHISALTAHSNIALLERQAREFLPDAVCVTDEKKAEDLRIGLADTGIKVLSGRRGLNEAAAADGADITLVAVVGIAGLEPTLAAIDAGKDIAIANKETLVTGGHIVTRRAKEKGVKLLPVDSEHSAIFQSLQSSRHREIKRILLTASGGAFYGKKRAELEGVTPQMALHNPNWEMGAKVTVDSSTLVNKGLEIIEAKWLFDVPIDCIKVIVHRQSIVHSMVEYSDNAVIAQLGTPDMRLPIQYALTYPNRRTTERQGLDLTKCGTLTFEEPDTETFFALELARRAGRDGGIMPTIFNAADEAAVNLFLRGKITYNDISDTIAAALDEYENITDPSVDEILAADAAVNSKIMRGFE